MMKKHTDITIRPAVATDVPAIAAILRELGWFPHINEESPADTEARVARHLELCNSDNSHSILVSETPAGEVVGYVVVHWLPYLMLAAPEGYISELFVFEAERGKGIGGRLLAAVNDEATERGCSRLHLITGDYRPSYTIYKKLGWNERPKIADFIYPLM